MSGRLSRRSIAMHAADRLYAGDNTVIDEIAALLVSEGRVRELSLLVRDIEERLESMGLLVITVETARALDTTGKRQINEMFPGKTVQIREVLRPELIGGCRIMTPRQMLDASLAARLASLRAMKV